MAKALTIGCHEWSGRVGIEADARVFSAFNVWTFAALTGEDGVTRSLERLTADIDHAAEAGIDAIKIGRLDSPQMAENVAESLKAIPAPVVYHPALPEAGTVEADRLKAALREYLLPLTSLLVLNTDQAQEFLGLPVRDATDMRRAARTLGHLGSTAVLVTGGSMREEAARDILWNQGRDQWFEAPWHRPDRSVGKGAALSAAAAAGLALGWPLTEALQHAKQAVRDALAQAPDVGWEALAIRILH